MSTSLARRTTVRLAGLALIGLVGVGCGGDDPGLEVSGAWSRTTAEGQPAGAAYMTLVSDEDDAIVGASVPDDVAGKVELHETVAAEEGAGSEDGGGMEAEDETSETTEAEGDEGMADEGGMDGSMTMVPVERIELPAGEEVALEPGGLHIMLLELAGPLDEGDAFTVTLSLESGEEVEVDLEVADDAP